MILATSVCAVTLGLSMWVYRAYRDTFESIEDTYAIMEVTDILIQYLETHQAAPPSNWQDLQDAYQYVDSGYNAFSFGELCERVNIDFARLASALNVSSENGSHKDRFRVISAKKNGQLERAETAANERLWEVVTTRGTNKAARNRGNRDRVALDKSEMEIGEIGGHNTDYEIGGHNTDYGKIGND